MMGQVYWQHLYVSVLSCVEDTLIPDMVIMVSPFTCCEYTPPVLTLPLKHVGVGVCVFEYQVTCVEVHDHLLLYWREGLVFMSHVIPHNLIHSSFSLPIQASLIVFPKFMNFKTFLLF